MLPVLPIVRAPAADLKTPPSEFARNAQTDDPMQCSYWRHCAIDGYLCSCCGGGVHTCPPGTSPSPTSWIGTCYNPEDGNSYLIAYRDCCGMDGCGQCICIGTDGDLPVYRPSSSNDIIWCFGAQQSMMYHCTTAVLVGLAG
jgi:methylamine dehydrogenase light chain